MSSAAVIPNVPSAFDRVVLHPFQKAVEGCDALRNDTDALGTALQFGHYGFRAVELVKTTQPVTQVLGTVAHSIAILDFLQIISDINYFVSGKVQEDWKNKKFCAIAASSVFPIATVGGIFLWFVDLTILKGGLSLIPIIGNVVIGAALVGHVFGAADAVQSIFQAKNGAQLAHGIIILISKVADVALHIILFIPGAGLPAVIVLGIVAKGVGVVAFFVKYYNKESFETQEEVGKVA